MVDRLEFRVSQLTRMSGHYRELAAGLFPENVSTEIEAIANAFDDEAARIGRECVGRRVCPCEFSSSCAALVEDGSDLEALNVNEERRPAQSHKHSNRLRA